MLNVVNFCEPMSKFERQVYIPELLVMIHDDPVDVCFTNIEGNIRMTCHWRKSGYTGHVDVNNIVPDGALRRVYVNYGATGFEINPVPFEEFHRQGRASEYFSEYLPAFDWWKCRVYDWLFA